MPPKKSSLGSRRSSVLPLRLSSIDLSNQGTRVTEKRCISVARGHPSQRSSSTDHLKFGQRRSSSVDRSSHVRTQLFPSTGDRAYSALNLITPQAGSNNFLESDFAWGRGFSSANFLSSLRVTIKDGRDLSDKQTQAFLAKKIETFFKRDLNTSALVQNGFNLRNITLRQFVEMMKALLSHLWPDYAINIDMTNYAEQILHYMKNLGYCGKLSKQWIQTANTASSWPHVLGVLSWLVDFIEFGDNCEDSLSFDAEDSIGNDDLIPPKLLLHNLLLQYDCWLKQHYDEMTALVDTLKKGMATYLGFGDHEYSLVENDVKELQAKIDSKNLPHRKNLKETVKNKKEEIKHLLNEIDKFNTQREALSNKIGTLKQKIGEEETTAQKLKFEIEELEKKHSSQSIILEGREKALAEFHELGRIYENKLSSRKALEKDLHNGEVSLSRAKEKLNNYFMEHNRKIDGFLMGPKGTEIMIDPASILSDYSHVTEKLRKLVDESQSELEKTENAKREIKIKIKEAENNTKIMQVKCKELIDSLNTTKDLEIQINKDFKNNILSLKTNIEKLEKIEKSKEERLAETLDCHDLKELERLKNETLEKIAFVEKRSAEMFSTLASKFSDHIKRIKGMDSGKIDFGTSEDDD